MEEIKLFDISEPKEVQNDINLLKLEKEKEYKNYIDTHITNVKKAFDELYSNNWINSTYNADILDALNTLKNIIDEHDLSKYSDEEFDAYRRYFYPINEQEKNDAEQDYQDAWKHHYTVNDHHPEHWYIAGKATDMSMRAILEMICDWQSFVFIGKGNATVFWFNNPEGKAEKEKIMTPKTIETVERILKLLNYKEN